MRMLVVGSAQCVYRDLAAIGPLPQVVIAVNDMIHTYRPRIDHAATLHAEKLDGWRLARWKAGGNPDYVTWGRPEKPGTDRTLSGWTRGSSGLFGVGVALGLGATSVILAGVPMTDDPHVGSDEPWDSVRLYKETWEKRLPQLRGRVFSMSGWTHELLGPPPGIRTAKAA